MPNALDTGTATVGALVVVLGLAVIFTRMWMNDTTSKAVQQLHVLGRPGRNYKLGGAWARAATRDPVNFLCAALALVGWIALVISLDVVRR